jgi:hypothetical protein
VCFFCVAEGGERRLCYNLNSGRGAPPVVVRACGRAAPGAPGPLLLCGRLNLDLEYKLPSAPPTSLATVTGMLPLDNDDNKSRHGRKRGRRRIGDSLLVGRRDRSLITDVDLSGDSLAHSPTRLLEVLVVFLRTSRHSRGRIHYKTLKSHHRRRILAQQPDQVSNPVPLAGGPADGWLGGLSELERLSIHGTPYHLIISCHGIIPPP